MLENDFVKKVQGRMFTTFHFNVVVSVNYSVQLRYPLGNSKSRRCLVYSVELMLRELMVISTPGGGRVENRLLIEIAHREE